MRQEDKNFQEKYGPMESEQKERLVEDYLNGNLDFEELRNAIGKEEAEMVEMALEILEESDELVEWWEEKHGVE